MSTRRKKAALALLLAGVAIWPAIHHGLVRSHGIDPWKLFGWAMYSVPNRQVRVRVVPIEGGEATRWVFPPAARDEVDRFIERRLSLGRFASARALGEAVLAHEPRFDEVDVVVQQRRLDLGSARIVYEEERTRVARGD